MALSVTCPSCGKSFQLAQEIYDRKVAGKIVSIRCKQCQAGIRIDATQPGELRVLGATPATTESAQGVRARQPTLIGMMGPSGPVTSGASAEGALWAVDSGGNGEDRELDDATIAREIAAGVIGPATLVWRDGMSDWLEVQQVPQLAKHLLAPKPAEPPKVAAPLPSAPAKQPSAPEAAALPPVEPKRAVLAPAVAPTAPAVAPTAPAAARAAAPAPAPAAPATSARPAGAKADAGRLPGVPVMHEEDDEDEATMIFRSSADAVSKLGLGDLPQEKTPVPAGPAPAAGKPTGSALGAGAAPRPGFGRAAGSSPLATGARPAGAAPTAGLGSAGRAAPRPGSSPVATASPVAGSSPLAATAPASPAARAPAAAPAPPTPAAAPPPPAPPAAAPAPPAAPPPPRAKQPSAPGLPRGLTPPPEPTPAPAAVAPPPPPMFPPPESAPAAPPPPPPSPPPAAVPTSPAAPAPMRARQPSASGLPRGLYPPPERPAPPPPSPPPAPPSTAPGFPSVQGGSQPMAQLAPNPFAVATTTDLEFPAQRSKTPLIIGGIVLVLAAAGIAVAVMGSGSRPAPPPVPPPAPAALAPTTPPAVTTTTQTAAPEAPTAPPPSKPSDDIAGTPRPTASSGDFSQMFAAGAQQAQKGGTTGSAKAFDPEEARTAVAGALKAVASCREPGGPSGQTSASITFDATGHVSSVTVGAPFSGTSTGTCIIGALKGVKVAPFSGLPGTVSQPVSLL